MAWDYAELSKTAKEAGGPEKLMDTVESTARAEGRSEMAPWIGLTAIAASGITYGITKLVRYFKEKKAISQDALKKAKEELVQGIKDYDATHSQSVDEVEKESVENE